MNRREFLRTTGGGIVAGTLAGCGGPRAGGWGRRGGQRLSVGQLRAWEAWVYGMFIHFQMGTFVRAPGEWPVGDSPASTYAPDKLDVDQWVSVARDAGMRYAVLTTKHTAGFCLWPSVHTDYTVAHSGNATDVVAKFVDACDKRGVKPGLYYCSSDGHHQFGSQIRPETSRGFVPTFPSPYDDELPPYTTSLYQNFMTAQITELLENYGPIAEMWIDIPGELGRGYRTFLYHYIAGLQPDTVIMMNSGTPESENYNVAYAWPSDLIAIERGGMGPPGVHSSRHRKWRTIEGKEFYVPGEICDPIGAYWFDVAEDHPRPDAELLAQYENAHQIGVNLLLNVPPNKHGYIRDEYVKALNRLCKSAQI